VPDADGGGRFDLSYDQREFASAWALAIYPGDDVHISRGISPDQLYYTFEHNTPPASVSWDGLDAEGQPLPANQSYLVYFEVDYANAITHYSGAFIPGKAFTTAELGVPQVVASTAIEGRGTMFTFDNSMVADPALTAMIWRFAIFSDDSQYVYESMWTGTELVSALPTNLVWTGLTNDGHVFPAGRYQAQVEMVIITSLGPQYTYANIWVPVVAPGQDITQTITSLPSPTPTPVPTPTPDPAAKLHPVLLIHGLTGYPEVWTDGVNNNDYPALLEGWGYPTDYVSIYHYSGVGVGIGGYNNQGDIPEMAAGMHDAVEELHDISLSHGGDGKVDIICHSMGGLIARQYLKDHPNDSYLGKVVSVGTPYQGSWLMDVNSNLGPLANVIDPPLERFLQLIGVKDLDASRVAEQEMTPGSNVLRSLDGLTFNPDIQYFTIYGSIKYQYDYNLFDLRLSSKSLDVGDGVVLESSATTVSSTQRSTPLKFADGKAYDIPIVLSMMSTGYTFASDVPLTALSPYFHNNLTKQPDVQAAIKKALFQ
jgi:pimeloyl-ACP methyl ester carboxylesterase